MPKLLILTTNASEYSRRVEAAHLPNLEIVTDTANCEIVLGEPRLIKGTLPDLQKLKWVQSIYAGAERLMDPALRRDYILTNARGVFGELMSEYVFGHLLFHEKRILKHYQVQESGRWERNESGVLRGKTIGLLGVGSIGAHLSGTARHFGMAVRGFTRESESCHEVDAYYHPPDIIRFAEGLDYLVSVLPWTEATHKIVDKNLLGALPSHAIFINVGRGNAVDETALVEALRQGRIAAAVLDVFEIEPLPKGHPFWSAPNLLMTFHTSAISYPEDITKIFIENYMLYVEDKPLKYRVDFGRGY